MSAEPPYDGQISTPEDFEDALALLLQRAWENDVDPRGAWVYRARDGHPDFEATVVELDGRSD